VETEAGSATATHAGRKDIFIKNVDPTESLKSVL
jgi:hypothetical protein